jgi:hypothetical protein
MNSSGPTNLVLLVYGQKGSNYLVVSGTNLANPTNWTPTADFILTNSFEFINMGVASNRPQFFRAKKQ